MTLLLLLVFHAPILWSAWRLAGCATPRTGVWRGADALLIGAALWSVEVLLLGTVGALTPLGVGVSHVVIAAGVACGTRRFVPAAGESSLPGDSSPPGDSRANHLALGVFSVSAVVTAAARVVWLPDPYDSLTYHLWFPAVWFDTGALSWVATPFGDLAPTYAPAFLEHFFLGLFFPFGADLWARVGQLPFLFLLFVSIASLVRGAARWEEPVSGRAWIAAGAAVLLPELWAQGTSSLADVGAAALFVAALAHLQRVRREESSIGHATLAGIAAGLFVASRYPSLISVTVLIVVAGIATRRRSFVYFAVGLVGLGGYAFLRNFVATGNPVYPVHLEFLGFELPGLYTQEAIDRSPFGYRSWKHLWDNLLATVGWLGVLALAAVPPLAVGGWFGPQRERTSGAARLAVIAGALVVLHFLFVPYERNLRFLFPAWATTVAALAVAWPRGRVAAAFGVAVSFAWGVGSLGEFPAWFFREVEPRAWPAWASSRMTIAWGLAVAGLGVAIGFILVSRGRLERWGLAIVGLLALAFGFEALDARRKERWLDIQVSSPRYRDFADGLEFLHARPAGSRVVYAGQNLPYLVRGETRGLRVFSLATDGDEGSAPHHHTGNEFRPSDQSTQVDPSRANPDFERWWKGLLRERVDYVVVFVQRTLVPGMEMRDVVIERAWMEQSPRFERIWPRGDEPGTGRAASLEVYRVVESN